GRGARDAWSGGEGDRPPLPGGEHPERRATRAWFDLSGALWQDRRTSRALHPRRARGGTSSALTENTLHDIDAHRALARSGRGGRARHVPPARLSPDRAPRRRADAADEPRGDRPV